MNRITPHRQFELGQSTVQARLAQAAKLQQQLSSGFRVSRPSDDPRGQQVILNQQSLISRYSAQLTAVETARSTLSLSATQVRDAQQLMVTAKTLALEARQTVDPTQRRAMADHIDSLIRQMESLANTSANGVALFSGTEGGAAFSGVGQSFGAYLGGTSPGDLTLPGLGSVRVLYTGLEVFRPPAAGSLSITGSTGIQPATGTSSGAAQASLQIAHTQTTYAGASGLAAGASSAAGDTVLGPLGAHTVQLRDTSGTGASGTISLNGGPEFEWTSADANLQVMGPFGEVIYVDLQNIAAGFDGVVDLTADGTLSLDGGQTVTAIDFSASQTLSDAAQGVVQHYDTTALRRTGTVQSQVEEVADVFETLRALRDDLLAADSMSAAELDAALDRRLQQLDAASDHLLGVIGRQSIGLQQLDTFQTRVEDAQLLAEETLANVQGADYTRAILQLQEQQNLLQYSFATLSALSNLSILDFLR